MNDRSTILKIIRHPLIKQLMENKMATSSVITKLIAEELTLNEAFSKPQQIIDALKVLQASSGEIPEVAAFLQKIKTGEFDKKLYRAAAMKSHPDRGGDEETFKAISGFSGINLDLLSQTIQQAGGKQAAPQQGQGEAASKEVLASVKQVIEKYQKGYESFLQMIADLKQDPALYYTDEKIQQIYKNLGALQEEIDINTLKDPDPKKSFEKAAKALEAVKNKILQLIKSKLSDSKKQQVQEAEEKEKSTGAELVVKTKKGEMIPVKSDDQKKVVEIFQLIQDWISIYKFIITEFAQDIKTLGGDPQKQLPPPAQKLLATKVELLLPPPEKLLPAPFKPETEELPDEPEEETAEPEEKPEPTGPADEQPPEPINKEDVKNYIEALQEFLDNFMKVRTLKEQSDIFYKFQQSILKLTGKPTDEIVGDQIAALTRTAQNLTEQEEPKTFQKSAVKGETKDILTGAQVTQRHVKAVQQIMKDYSKYLEKVTVGSRELFDKFGESDPKKVLYKFVKLLSNDIDQMIQKMNSMKKKIKDASTQPPEQQELNEQKKMSLKEKIDLVEEVYIYVRKHGVDLRNAISQFVEEDEADKGKEKAGEEEQPAEPQVQKEQKEDVGARTARPDKEVYGNYKQLALDIDDQLERIANFFPTARPFDSKYTMKQAQKSFLTVIKKLDTVVANVQNFLRDEDINVPTLNDLTQELSAIKEVMKSIFGLTDEQNQAENQAAVSDAGEASGLPQAPEKEEQGTEAQPSEDLNQLKQKIDKAVEDYEGYMSAVFNLLTMPQEISDGLSGSRKDMYLKFLDSHFELLANSAKGKMTGSTSEFKNSFSQSRSTLRIEKKKLFDMINDEIKRTNFQDVSGLFEKFQSEISGILRKIVNQNVGAKPNEQAINEAVSSGRIRELAKILQSIIVQYYIIRATSRIIDEKDIKELDIKSFENQIDQFVNQIQQSQLIISNSYKELEGEAEKINFFKKFMNMRLLTPSSIKDKPKEKASKETGEEKPEETSKETGEEKPEEVGEEQEIEEIVDEVVGELIPKVSEFGSVMPKYEDPNGQLNIKNKEVKQIIDQEIENIEIPDEVKQDQVKMDDLKNKIQMKVSTELEDESGGKDLNTRLSEFLDDNESSVVTKFLNALTGQGLIKEDLAGVFKNFGDIKLIKRALRKLSPEEKTTLQTIIGDSNKRNKLLKVMGTVSKSDLSKEPEKKIDFKQLSKNIEEKIKSLSPEKVIVGNEGLSYKMKMVQAKYYYYKPQGDTEENKLIAANYQLDPEREIDNEKLKDALNKKKIAGADLSKGFVYAVELEKDQDKNPIEEYHIFPYDEFMEEVSSSEIKQKQNEQKIKKLAGILAPYLLNKLKRKQNGKKNLRN